MDYRTLFLAVSLGTSACVATEDPVDEAPDATSGTTTTDDPSGTSADESTSLPGSGESSDGSTSTTGPAADPCPIGQAQTGFFVESATLDSLPDGENPSETFDLACRVAGAPQDDVFAFACDEGGAEEVAWTVTLETPPSFALQLSDGDAVQMRYRFERAFEVGSTRQLQLSVSDQAILYAYASNLDGGLVGLCGPGEENGENAVEAFLLPLGLGVERGTCDPIHALRLDFFNDTATTEIYTGEEAEIGTSGWSAAAGAATCQSQEDDPEGFGSDLWDISVLAWRPDF